MVKAPYHQLRRPRAVAPAGCPVDHGFSPYRSDYLKNPYPGLRDLRTKTPVFYAAELGYVVLTRMADVAEVFKRADVFSSEIVQDPVLPICAAARAVLDVPDYAPIAVMSNCAPPDHARIRKHTLAGFSAHRMRVLAPYIRTRAETLVAQMLADGEPAEFVRAGGRPLTWLFGLSRVTSAACFTAALVYVSLVEASLLGLMSVTGAALMAWRLRGARPGRAEFVCHTILVGGVVSLALLVEDGWRNPAVLLMAVSELAVIASTFTAEYHPENQTEDPRARLWLTGIALSVTAAMMLTARLGQTTLWADGEVAEIWQAVRDWRLWLIGGAVGVVLRGPATFLAFWAIHRHGADAYILATALLPVFGLAMEWALAQPGWVPPITLTLPVYAVGTAMIAALVTLALARLRAGQLSPKT